MWARVKLGQALLQPAQNSQPNQFRHDQFKVKKKEGQKWVKKRNTISKVIKKNLSNQPKVRGNSCSKRYDSI